MQKNKSIGDYKTYGAFIRGAEKGPGMLNIVWNG